MAELSTKSIERTVSSLERGLTIFDAFLQNPGELSLGQLEEHTKLFKSVILRYMLSFEAHGYIRRTATGKYALGPTLFQLGKQYESSLDLEGVVLPLLDALSKFSSESAFMSVRQGNERLCLMRVDSPHQLRVSATPGSTMPLDASATARVLVDFESGPAPGDLLRRSDGVGDPLTASLAAPIFGLGGKLVGALTVCGPTSRFDNSKADLARFTLDCARRASQALGAPSEAVQAG